MTLTQVLMSPMFLACATAVLLSLGALVVKKWFELKRFAVEAELKRQMVEQGMSADDITRVLEAGANKKPASDD